MDRDGAGMSTGADPKTMPSTPEYVDGHVRVFGDKKPQRGRWVQHPRTGKLIPAEEYASEQGEEARNAPFMIDRFMENSSTQEGIDIGSRRKRREYMKATGSADASDYSKGYFEKARTSRDKKVEESTRKTVAEVSKLDTRHLPKFIEEGKKR